MQSTEREETLHAMADVFGGAAGAGLSLGSLRAFFRERGLTATMLISLVLHLLVVAAVSLFFAKTPGPGGAGGSAGGRGAGLAGSAVVFVDITGAGSGAGRGEGSPLTGREVAETALSVRGRRPSAARRKAAGTPGRSAPGIEAIERSQRRVEKTAAAGKNARTVHKGDLRNSAAVNAEKPLLAAKAGSSVKKTSVRAESATSRAVATSEAEADLQASPSLVQSSSHTTAGPAAAAGGPAAVAASPDLPRTFGQDATGSTSLEKPDVVRVGLKRPSDGLVEDVEDNRGAVAAHDGFSLALGDTARDKKQKSGAGQGIGTGAEGAKAEEAGAEGEGASSAAAGSGGRVEAGPGGAGQGLRIRGLRPPQYPLLARLRGEEGSVEIGVSIGPGGRLLGMRVLSSSGFVALDRAALRAVRRSRFVLPSGAGHGVASEKTIVFVFRLKDSDGY